MDFGLARSPIGRSSPDAEGAVLGTPAYMSPEQINGDTKLIGPCCDIYSLGVILYELLTGRLPFEGPITAVFAQVLTREPAPPSTHRPGLDPRLEAICLKAMAKRPQDRHASMAELGRRPRGMAARQHAAARCPGVRTPHRLLRRIPQGRISSRTLTPRLRSLPQRHDLPGWTPASLEPGRARRRRLLLGLPHPRDHRQWND